MWVPQAPVAHIKRCFPLALGGVSQWTEDLCVCLSHMFLGKMWKVVELGFNEGPSFLPYSTPVHQVLIPGPAFPRHWYNIPSQDTTQGQAHNLLCDIFIFLRCEQRPVSCTKTLEPTVKQWTSEEWQ